MELFLHPNCVPFTVALGFVIFLSLYQIGALVWGLGLPGALDTPDLPDLPQTRLGVCFDWLNLGRVPLVVTLILFSWVFAALGLIIQNTIYGMAEFTLPVVVLAPAVGAFALVLLHWLIPPVARLLPKDETSAIDEDYIGRTAIITIGTATADKPAEARARDRYGRDRYLRVIPDISGQALEAGSSILIVGRTGNLHTAIRHDD